METSTPSIAEAKEFADGIHAKFPGKLLAYNCSPSFNWRKHLSEAEIATYQQELGKMGYKFQFVTLAGFHALNYSMFDLAHGYNKQDMGAYSKLQTLEFDAESRGYTATKHQREVRQCKPLLLRIDHQQLITRNVWLGLEDLLALYKTCGTYSVPA